MALAHRVTGFDQEMLLQCPRINQASAWQVHGALVINMASQNRPYHSAGFCLVLLIINQILRIEKKMLIRPHLMLH